MTAQAPAPRASAAHTPSIPSIIAVSKPQAPEPRNPAILPSVRPLRRGLVLFHRPDMLAPDSYRKAATEQMAAALIARGWTVRFEHLDCNRPMWGLREIAEASAVPLSAVLRWEEGARLFTNAEWIRACAWMHECDILPAQVDFGYFGHYDSRLLVPWKPDGEPDTSPWATAPATLDWNRFIPAVRAWRDYMAGEWEHAGKLGPVPGLEPGYVLIYQQFSHRLSVLPGAPDYRTWAAKAAQAVRQAGLVPVFKLSKLHAERLPLPEGVRGFVEADGIPHLNTRLLRYARHSVIITSTVSAESVVRGLPVMACGKGFHAGLGVFGEARDWADLAMTPEVDPVARAKWINGWASVQFPPEQFGERFDEALRRFHDSRPMGQALFSLGVGLGNHLMAVPAMKAIAAQSGQRVRLASKAGTLQAGLDWLSAQSWAGPNTNRRWDFSGVNTSTGVAFMRHPPAASDLPPAVRRVEQGITGQQPHESERNFAPARRVGFDGPMPSGRMVVRSACIRALPPAYVAVAMDCTDGEHWSKRRWPHWQEFSRLWNAGPGRRPPLVFVGVKPAPWAASYGLDLLGQTTIEEAADIIQRAELLVGIDGGLSHVAAAVRTPSLLIYGPTTSLANGPTAPSVTVLCAGVDCRPCFATQAWGACQNAKCLSQIAPQRVVNAAQQILEQRGLPIEAETRAERLNARLNMARRLGVPAAQRPGDLMEVWRLIEAEQPRVVVEIGSLRGGWLYTVAPAVPRPATLIGIDPTPNAGRQKVGAELAREGYAVQWIQADSHKTETLAKLKALLCGAPVDVLHIDGDHSLAGVAADWDMYAPLVRPGGLVLLHDAANPTEPVPAAVAELKKRTGVAEWRHVEDRANGGLVLGVAVARMGG
ncbi:MAG TPA: CmcI family methyltransferase [Candidatus Brocadiia bacterium]|nr:CmcI family methyltransferase [Candidatus Brocadiia bacterium]